MENRINNIESKWSKHSEKAFYGLVSVVMIACTSYIKSISDDLKENKTEIVQLKLETRELSGRLSSLERWRPAVDDDIKDAEKRLSTIEKQNERHELQLRSK